MLDENSTQGLLRLHLKLAGSGDQDDLKETFALDVADLTDLHEQAHQPELLRVNIGRFWIGTVDDSDQLQLLWQELESGTAHGTTQWSASSIVTRFPRLHGALLGFVLSVYEFFVSQGAHNVHDVDQMDCRALDVASQRLRHWHHDQIGVSASELELFVVVASELLVSGDLVQAFVEWRKQGYDPTLGDVMTILHALRHWLRQEHGANHVGGVASRYEAVFAELSDHTKSASGWLRACTVKDHQNHQAAMMTLVHHGCTIIATKLSKRNSFKYHKYTEALRKLAHMAIKDQLQAEFSLFKLSVVTIYEVIETVGLQDKLLEYARQYQQRLSPADMGPDFDGHHVESNVSLRSPRESSWQWQPPTGSPSRSVRDTSTPDTRNHRASGQEPALRRRHSPGTHLTASNLSDSDSDDQASVSESDDAHSENRFTQRSRSNQDQMEIDSGAGTQSRPQFSATHIARDTHGSLTVALTQAGFYELCKLAGPPSNNVKMAELENFTRPMLPFVHTATFVAVEIMRLFVGSCSNEKRFDRRSTFFYLDSTTEFPKSRQFHIDRQEEFHTFIKPELDHIVQTGWVTTEFESRYDKKSEMLTTLLRGFWRIAEPSQSDRSAKLLKAFANFFNDSQKPRPSKSSVRPFLKRFVQHASTVIEDARRKGTLSEPVHKALASLQNFEPSAAFVPSLEMTFKAAQTTLSQARIVVALVILFKESDMWKSFPEPERYNWEHFQLAKYWFLHFTLRKDEPKLKVTCSIRCLAADSQIRKAPQLWVTGVTFDRPSSKSLSNSLWIVQEFFGMLIGNERVDVTQPFFAKCINDDLRFEVNAIDQVGQVMSPLWANAAMESPLGEPVTHLLAEHKRQGEQLKRICSAFVEGVDRVWHNTRLDHQRRQRNPSQANLRDAVFAELSKFCSRISHQQDVATLADAFKSAQTYVEQMQVVIVARQSIIEGDLEQEFNRRCDTRGSKYNFAYHSRHRFTLQHTLSATPGEIR
ncbi:hypothetical protein OIO90_002943 [Microbotryomycetes sp. JL221]|nr:hypothetical protein OIO90_002943 [Microbotryomycetes sp. JL221]